MSTVAAGAVALPEHVVTQEQAKACCERVYAGQERLARLLRVLDTVGVRQRHFAFPAEYYLEGRSFEDRNADFREAGLKLAERAARACLDRAGVEAGDIDHLVLATTTGLATPSLDALLVGRLGMRPDVRRWPLFGLGCAGGAGALLRAADLTPGAGRALVVAVELCGQVFSPRALRPVDVIGAALFGDGAVAALVEGEGGRGPRIRAGRTQLFPGTEHLMGWSFTGDGMRILLSPEVAPFVGDRLKPAVEKFLRDAKTAPAEIAWWMLHPGGRRIIEEYERAFDLPAAALEWTRSSLARVGNLSSASVLAILSDVFESGRPAVGDRGLVIGVGPGFSAEMILLEW